MLREEKNIPEQNPKERRPVDARYLHRLYTSIRPVNLAISPLCRPQQSLGGECWKNCSCLSFDFNGNQGVGMSAYDCRSAGRSSPPEKTSTFLLRHPRQRWRHSKILHTVRGWSVRGAGCSSFLMYELVNN